MARPPRGRPRDAGAGLPPRAAPPQHRHRPRDRAACRRRRPGRPPARRALPAATPAPARPRRRQRAAVLTPNPGDAGPEGSRYIPYRPDNGAWLNAAGDQPWLRLCRPAALDGRRDDAGHGAGGRVDLKLGHYATDGIEVIDVRGEIDMYTAPRLRELLIDLVSMGSYQLVVNLGKVGFLDSTGLGVLVGA